MKKTVQPWYREPWPWILMSGPAIVVVAGVVTAYIAVTTSDGLVEDDYYKQGLAVNQRVVRNEKASEIAVHADVVRGGDDLQLLVFLRGNETMAMPAALNLAFAHPTRSGIDQKLVLPADGRGGYLGKLNAPLNGRWHVALEDDQKSWRLVGDWNIEKQSTLQLAAAPNHSVSKER